MTTGYRLANNSRTTDHALSSFSRRYTGSIRYFPLFACFVRPPSVSACVSHSPPGRRTPRVHIRVCCAPRQTISGCQVVPRCFDVGLATPQHLLLAARRYLRCNFRRGCYLKPEARQREVSLRSLRATIVEPALTRNFTRNCARTASLGINRCFMRKRKMERNGS